MDVKAVIGNFELGSVQKLVDDGFVASILKEEARFKQEDGNYMAKHVLIPVMETMGCGMGFAVTKQFGIEPNDVFAKMEMPETKVVDGETLYYAERYQEFVPFEEFMNSSSEGYNALSAILNEQVAPAINEAVDMRGGKVSFEFNFYGLAWVYEVPAQVIAEKLIMN